MIAVLTTGQFGTQIDLYDVPAIDDLNDDAPHWDTLTVDDVLDQPAVVELLADHHWELYSGWAWNEEFGTCCVVYQTH